MNHKSIFLIAAQFGGTDSIEFKPIFLEFKKLVESGFKNSYGNLIHEFSIIFRIDGNISSWEKKGINRMRLMKSRNYITIDIGITKDILNLPESEIWEFVWEEFEKATLSMINKLKKSKIDFNFEKLESDFTTFKNKIL